MGALDIASGFGEFLGGEIGNALSYGDRQSADEEYKKALAELYGVDPQELVQYAPEQVGPSEMGKIQSDPALRSAQIAALRKMQLLGDEGGMSTMDRARMNEIDADVNQQDAARRGAILTNARARGVGGSGLELANQLDSVQAGAERASEAGFRTQAEAQRRALEAMMKSGQLGGEIRGQDFGEDAQKAGAQDQINKLNAQLRFAANQANNNSLQQTFNNKMEVAKTRAGGRRYEGDRFMGKAKATQNQWAGRGKAVGSIAGGAFDYADEDGGL